MKTAARKVTLLDHMGSDLPIVNSAYTATQIRILEAVERGYHIEDDVLFGPKGKLKIACCRSQRYPTFSTNWGGRVFGIPVHLFAAYMYYGKAAFTKGVVVRHINGNTTDFSKQNLRLGSHSDNNLDKSPAVRKAAAVAARAAQGYPPHNAKLSQTQVEQVRTFYQLLGGKKASNGSVAQLGRELGVSKTVLTKIKNGEYYANI